MKEVRRLRETPTMEWRDAISLAPTLHLAWGFISQTVFVKSFSKSQLPHISVNLSFIITNIKN